MMMHNCMRVFAPGLRCHLSRTVLFSDALSAHGQDNPPAERCRGDLIEHLKHKLEYPDALAGCSEAPSTASKQMIVNEWTEEAGGGLEEAIKGDQWT